MAVTENQLIHREDGIVGGGPVAAGEVLYIGTLAFVDAASGFIVAAAAAGANKFAGVVRDFADNSGGVDGDVQAAFFERSSVRLPLAGAAQDDVGKKVNATDNYTLTLGAGTLVGTITRVYADATVLVALDVQLP